LNQDGKMSYERNNELIDEAKRLFEAGKKD